MKLSLLYTNKQIALAQRQLPRAWSNRWRRSDMSNHTPDSSQDKTRFLSKISKNPKNGCWEWTGTLFSTGYACFWMAGKSRKASRVSFEFFKGPIAAGLCVLHTCDNRKCVNPDHLWLGSNAENSDDMKTKGRAKGGSPPGERAGKAKLTELQVRAIRAEYSLGNTTQTALGKKYGVTSVSIGQIVHRQHWKHIP